MYLHNYSYSLQESGISGSFENKKKSNLRNPRIVKILFKKVLKLPSFPCYIIIYKI